MTIRTSGSESDEALADIERAIKRFEEIILKRLSKQGGRSSAARTGITVAQSLFGVLLSAKNNRRSPDFNPNAGGSNRFPTSSGQIFADIAGVLRTISGRNL